jgi:hypothetical protein
LANGKARRDGKDDEERVRERERERERGGGRGKKNSISTKQRFSSTRVHNEAH